MYLHVLICALVALAGCVSGLNNNPSPDAQASDATTPDSDARTIDATVDARPVDATNLAPEIRDDELTATTFVNCVLDVLENDVSGGNAPFTVVIESSTHDTTVYYRTEPPDQGKVWYKTVLPAGSTDNFTYTVIDHDGDSSTAHVLVHIVALPP